MSALKTHPIRSLLHVWSVIANQKAASVKKVLEIISDRIAGNYPNINSDELFDHLLQRERLGSTYIGHGVAMPHCRLAHCTQPVGILMQLKEPVLFDLDGQSSDLVFALVVPAQFQQAHLDIISALAQAFQNEKYRASLRAAEDNQKLYKAALTIQ